MSITLRTADDNDALFILTLEEVCMRAYAEALWGEWRPSASLDTLDLAGHQVIEVDGTAIGCVASTWHDDHLFINKLYIDPAYQSKGLGALALRAKCEEALTNGLPTKLSVLTTNPADRFYRREGFVVESETAERRRMARAATAL